MKLIGPARLVVRARAVEAHVIAARASRVSSTRYGRASAPPSLSRKSWNVHAPSGTSSRKSSRARAAVCAMHSSNAASTVAAP